MTLMSEKISVIVPVYKVEPYLRKCVGSILAQTYQNLEIILVDDGSPDNCGAICDEYAKQDSRITVIHKPNSGLSDARNAGLDCATGEYITFVDSDDWIDPQHVSALYTSLQEGADIAVSDIRRVNSNHDLICTFCFQQKDDIVYESVFGYVWNKLYRRSVVENARFSINYIEDVIFNLQIHCTNKPRYAFTNSASYNYLLRENSLLTASVSTSTIIAFSLFSETLLGLLPNLYHSEDEQKAYYSFVAGNQACNLLCQISSDRHIPLSRKSSYMKSLFASIPQEMHVEKYSNNALMKLLNISKKLSCPIVFHFIYQFVLRFKRGHRHE